MAKVIDITARLKQSITENNSIKTDGSAPQVIQIDQFKNSFKPTLVHERRQVQRTLLSEMISGCLVLPEKGLFKVALYDISKQGLSFELDPQMGAFKVGEELALRVYVNTKTYFPLMVRVKHATFDTQENIVRHGVDYLQGAQSDVALQHFINFVISVSEGLKVDQGDYFAGPFTN